MEQKPRRKGVKSAVYFNQILEYLQDSEDLGLAITKENLERFIKQKYRVKSPQRLLKKLIDTNYIKQEKIIILIKKPITDEVEE